MSTFNHFAYGSNLSLPRIRQRCPSATPLAVGRVRRRQLRFHKVGRDGTGKADAFWTGDPRDVVWGVIYRCRIEDKAELDRCEMLGDGYDATPVEVATRGGVWLTFLYAARPQRIDPEIVPAAWYHQHVVDGAREHRFPRAYQRQIAEERRRISGFEHQLNSSFTTLPCTSVKRKSRPE